MDEEQDISKAIKKKGRPKKIIKRLGSTPSKPAIHINTIRVQLQPLRLLSDMVKKREKTKYKVLESEQEIFLEKVGITNRNMLGWPKTNGKGVDSTGQEDSS